jgi:negative regulator of genetic competence, sporulation and motility
LEFLNIGDTKLKVTLSEEECREYGIDTSKTDFTRGEIRSVMRDIIALAEERCGFFVTSEKILVQLYPLPGGVCEIFVTKLTGLPSKDRAALRLADGLSMYERRRGIYRFASREELIKAARAISEEPPECEVYTDEVGQYYIAFEESLTDGISEQEILIEYGERLKDLPLHVLAEYGKLLISENALEKIISGDF